MANESDTPMNPISLSYLPRRAMFKRVAIAGAATWCSGKTFGQSPRTVSPTAQTITTFLESLRNEDHGYGWGDQERSHLTPTFGVIGSYHLLKIVPPDREALAQFVRTHHPREQKRLMQEIRVFDWQQAQALTWLEADTSSLTETISLFSKPIEFKQQYEQHGYPVSQSELSAVLARSLLGLSMTEIADAYGDYIDKRRRPNGSYNNTPAADGGDGHVMTTLLALQANRGLGRELPAGDALVAWLQACQLSNGGFTYQPQPMFGGVDDIAYVRAAVRALQLFGAAPTRRDACIAYIHSLANADGGFSDRPGWLSNAIATYYAIDALDALGAIDSLDSVQRRPLRQPTKLPRDLKVFSAVIEAHGTGSPADAVEIARSLKIDLWGAKNAKPGWGERFVQIAAERQVPVMYFTANEEYGTWIDVPGLGIYSHTSDIVAPMDSNIGMSLGARDGSAPPVSWPEFRRRRLEPLQRGDGRLLFQFCQNEQLVRMYLDDSLERGGFAAIQTFHFGNVDHTTTEAFLNRWRGRIPFVSIQDAHGPEPWFFLEHTAGFRTLFLATEPSWDGWLNALKQNWTVPVRRDSVSQGQMWMHSGSDEVLALVREREADWRWWDNPECSRPLVSIVAVRPTDEFEVGRPESGINIRVRCAWQCTWMGLLVKPIAQLVSLSIDGREVSPSLVETKQPDGKIEEYSHHFALSATAARGKHTATAIVRELESNQEVMQSIEFQG